MPATNAQLKKLIFECLKKEPERPMPIERFYNHAQQQLHLDEQDLISTIHKGKETGEPSWRRNLRNALQTSKNRGDIVNSSVGFWRLPTPDKATYINPVDAWKTIIAAAIKARAENYVWQSPINDQKYHVEAVEDNKIVIMRKGAGTTEDISENDVTRAFVSLNAAGGTLGRRAMIYIVAKEASIVQLHPDLTWDDTFDFIKVASITSSTSTKLAVIKKIAEADNDKQVYQPYARKIRKGQPALRKKLLEVYGHQCCITLTGPDSVLQAAHIEPHSRQGNNHSTNALLLRSDIHDLFDDGWLLIEPETLKIFVHPKLKGTVYEMLSFNTLKERSDGQTPDQEKLKERWEEYFWEKKYPYEV